MTLEHHLRNAGAMKNPKVDNSALAAKIELRLWLLKRMGIKEAYVLDTCAGLGKIWDEMQKHVTVRQWTRCDIKPRRAGTLKLDATEAIERFPLETYNVVDIDPYGEPWDPYMALLKRLTKPTAVFLTYCERSGICTLSLAAGSAVNIPEGWNSDLPHSSDLAQYVGELVLRRTWDYADIFHSAKMRVEKGGGALATYYALGLRPIQKPVSVAAPTEATVGG